MRTGIVRMNDIESVRLAIQAHESCRRRLKSCALRSQEKRRPVSSQQHAFVSRFAEQAKKQQDLMLTTAHLGARIHV
jgi:hypothetical protein